LVYPLIQGRDLKKWFSSTENRYIIIPHETVTGKPLGYEFLKSEFPKTYNYFNLFRQILEGRSLHKLWGKGNPFYAIYDIGGYTFAPYKVAWKEISGKISGNQRFLQSFSSTSLYRIVKTISPAILSRSGQTVPHPTPKCLNLLVTHLPFVPASNA